MEIYLKNVIFENDFFTVGTPDGGTLRLNKIDEKLNVSVLLKDVEINRINIDGTAPINGPKKGIIFVMPMITAINNEYSILNNTKTIKQIIPIIKESSSFPSKNLYRFLTKSVDTFLM